MKQIYQGDVSIIKIDKIDKKLSKFPEKGIIVAEGEITGHKHTLVANPKSDIQFGQDENGFYLKVNKGTATLTHQEHKEITIPQGLYFIGSQYEYDELKERKVMD